ncbi:M23 family metallopeptidase [Gymnodinialimonas hymeniacidonis]|uniref:M23 family metallopeptidase n=1 Tax=Gymnodinialimonas hymeniacidonis TaxID=3126508 RepID=UPI0034C69B58
MAALLALLTATPTLAQDALQLTFPVDCTLGESCVIQQLMDRDPGPEAQDFRCGSMTYDGHQGTDIRLPDFAAMATDVPVLAAAPGTVLGTRNTVPDTGIDGFPEGQDCGNGVVLDHGNGWQTQYCHLAQGSVSVASGDQVESGQPLGTIGYSGATEFPHLHISVRQDGTHVDPFDPAESNTCAIDATPLWADELSVPAGGILSAGFAETVPEYGAIQAGTANVESLPRNSEALVVWGFFHNGQAGDRVELIITDPAGENLHYGDITLERTQAQLFRASGLRIRNGLETGTYRGTVMISRNNFLVDSRVVTVDVP